MNNKFANITAMVLAPPVAIMTWWLLDREPPYIRTHGEIIPVDAGLCRVPFAGKGLVPGACVSVEWKVEPLRNCKPYGEFNVTRYIKDSLGKHVLPPIRSVYDQKKNIDSSITRYFVLPITSPIGPASYNSEAFFACNPLQRIFWPIVVTSDDILYNVEMPEFPIINFRGPIGPVGPAGERGPRDETGPKGP